MMETSGIRAWAARLGEARRSATALAASSGPAVQTIDEAYAIQAALIAKGGALRGYKVSALTAAAQAGMGVDRPVAGALLAPWTFDSPARLRRDALIAPKLECEYEFELSRALPARASPYGRAEVEAAIGAVRIAIEIPDSRIGEPVPPLLALADCVSNGAFIVGPAMENWRVIAYATAPVLLTIDGIEVARGNAAPILDGDPVGAVLALANAQAPGMPGLAAGHFVTTGTCTGALAAGDACRVVASFGALGEVLVTFE